MSFATHSSPAEKGAPLEPTDADGHPFSSLTTASCWILPRRVVLSPPRRKRSPAQEEPPRKIPFFLPQSPPVQGGAFRASHRRCGSIQHFDIDQTTRLKKFTREPS